MSFLRSSLFLIIFWIVAVFVLFFIGFHILPHQINIFPLTNWDGQHFLGIAQDGYTVKFDYAFFPLYPLTIWALTVVLENFILSAILINLISTFLALILLYKLVEQEYDSKVAYNTLINLLVFPTAFFFLVVYSESLFFLLTVGAFYFLRNKRILLASALGSLSALTRVSGLAVILVLFIFLTREKKLGIKRLAVFILPLGFLSYCIYLLVKTGNPLYFVVAEGHWQRSISFPGWGIPATIGDLSKGNLSNDKVMEILTVPFTAFGLGLVFRAFRFLKREYSLYSLVSILIPLLTPTLTSMPRFLLPIFPIFLVLALIKKPGIIFLYRIVSVGLSLIFITLFINGYWVS